MPTQEQVQAEERRNLMELMDGDNFRIPRREVDENIVIGTWNIQNLNERKEDRALQYMADIIERFDICAIQEVKTNLRGLSTIQEKLPGHYKVMVTDPTGNYERFAFIYDERTIEFTGLACELGLEQSTSQRRFQFQRMPYCASFRAGRFDFVIVTTHVFYSGDDTSLREQEIRLLAEHVVKRSKLPRRDDDKVFDRDFFVVGDFNIVEEGDEFFDALVNQGFEMPDNMNTLHTIFGQDATYDKIAWVPRDGFESGQCNVVPFNQVVYQQTGEDRGEQTISDHLPLWAEFRVNKLTQELDQIINPP